MVKLSIHQSILCLSTHLWYRAQQVSCGPLSRRYGHGSVSLQRLTVASEGHKNKSVMMRQDGRSDRSHYLSERCDSFLENKPCTKLPVPPLACWCPSPSLQLITRSCTLMGGGDEMLLPSNRPQTTQTCTRLVTRLPALLAWTRLFPINYALMSTH